MVDSFQQSEIILVKQETFRTLYYACDKCDKVIPSEKDIAKHMKEHNIVVDHVVTKFSRTESHTV